MSNLMRNYIKKISDQDLYTFDYEKFNHENYRDGNVDLMTSIHNIILKE